eukprot:307324_1
MSLFFFSLLLITPQSDTIEQWDQFEMLLNGPSSGNPFIDTELSATFSLNKEQFIINGFYDGNGQYKIRFMPNAIGTWSFVTKSNVAQLNKVNGTFKSISPSTDNYGPAFVNPKTNKSFIFANGNEYFPTGTTAYGWIMRNEKIMNQTLKTLQQTYDNNIFNKLRMAIFPLTYSYTKDNPIYYPYVGTSPNQWDYNRFNVSFWKMLDWSLQQIFKIGNGKFIADIILFHPYDHGKYGFDCLGCPISNYSACSKDANNYNISNDIFYLKYVVARLASYRHVWWAMANEFDLNPCKNIAIPQSFTIWDELFKALISFDPYNKEKSIHQCNPKNQYNYSRNWVTHFGIQGYEDTPRDTLMKKYNVQKPVILDEVHYEGNSTEKYTGGVIADRFWMGNANGNYVGHSEAFLPNNTDDGSKTASMWWSYGEKLIGVSPDMIGFFYQYMTDTKKYNHPPFSELTSSCLLYNQQNTFSCLISQLAKESEFYLIHWTDYATECYISSIEITLPEGMYQLSSIDYFNQEIRLLKNVTGPNFFYTAPNSPWNVQLVKI